MLGALKSFTSAAEQRCRSGDAGVQHADPDVQTRRADGRKRDDGSSDRQHAASVPERHAGSNQHV